MKNFALLVPAFAFITSSAMATGPKLSDDSDLSYPSSRHKGVTLELTADETETTQAAVTSIQLLRQQGNSVGPVAGIKISMRLADGSTAESVTNEDGNIIVPNCPLADAEIGVTATLSNQYFLISNGNGTYKLTAKATCGAQTKLLFKQDSNGGQALGIWQIGYKAVTKLKAALGLDFWREQLPFIWPGAGDYYSDNEVNITRGDQWDVVGHELGHAVYDMGQIGVFGGGQHKIDECYSTALALSEGWASYFSAWLSIDPSDEDAKFEFVVPRRAPIRIETIPGDVCKGQNNEWRATGFFWDLVDLHDDGETANQSFAALWNALKGTKVRSIGDAAKRLEKAGIPASVLNTVWELNFLTARP
jgi:hypothetical protein